TSSCTTAAPLGPTKAAIPLARRSA
ncbi:MAG: hypothetical protein AVDCRST_MAG93-6675, partial [uncultured Chloroflexia bacterium]